MSIFEAEIDVAPIVLPDDIAPRTYSDLIGAEKLFASEIAMTCLDDRDIAPFDEVHSDNECEYVIWVKSFQCSVPRILSRPVFRSYLKDLMPEIESMHNSFSSRRGNVEMSWFTAGARNVPLGELATELSPTTVGLVTGATTLDDLYSKLFTPATEALIAALTENNYFQHTGENLLEAIRSGIPAALADGML